MDNYQQLIERIAKASDLKLEEIERKVEAKRAKLSGLVSREGAAQIVAAELGLNLDKEKLKISELVQGMRKVNVSGKIIEMYPVREFNKNGREGKVVNFIIADESSNAKVVLWDTNHIKLVEDGKIEKGSVVEISNGNLRNGEIHLSSFSDIKLSKEKFDEVVSEKVFPLKKISDVKPGENAKIRAFVVQSFEPRYFEVCEECGKRVREGKCEIHGDVKGKKRALLNIVVDDGSETIRVLLVGDNIKGLGLEDKDIFSLEGFETKKKEILGEERIFSGQVRSNQLYNTVEFNAEKMEEVKPEELIKELEAKS